MKPDLKSVSTDELNRELERRAANAEKLIKKRERLLEELERIEGQIDGATTVNKRRPAAGPRRRPRNEMTLGDALANAMEVRAVVSPAEASQLVQANGYRTTSRNFNMMVSNTLAKDKRFKRVARGQYERIA